MELIVESRSIAQEIQLSVAPVFLLTAIAAFLTVLSNRMARATDQAREIILSPSKGELGELELDIAARLKRKLKLLQWGVACVVTAGFLVCLVVISIFIGDYLAPDLSMLIAVMFIAAMLLISAGFAFFLTEIGISSASGDYDFWA
ncbi:DUF2721 domain-containing protein [Maritalea sp.]|jgi:hypothetical protein|uniref:DUF2721 domain-containing protein n=1 Tax=Maritalea sp. TaxID=2003361 RepID=UPI0039E39F4D